jgi:pseudouridine synthase
MLIRLNKFLSQAGIASRREADRLIAEGRVKVNNRVVQKLGFKIDDQTDRIEINSREVNKEQNLIYLMLNKPKGYLVTLKDAFGRPTVMSLLSNLKVRVFPVGRLDYNSEGLLLLTNDGELTFRLTHPRYNIKKTYLVKVKGEPDSAKLSKLKKGVFLDGKKTAPAKVTLLESNPKRSLLRIEIHEGRKREVRRMLELIGHRVLKLVRVDFAGLKIGKLKSGTWRFLRQQEIKKLKEQINL